MEKGELPVKLKKLLREHPIPACIAVALSVFVLLGAVSLLRKLLPVSTPVDYARQFVNILWPLALTLLLGYAWCYRRGSFAKTLLAGLFAFILFSLTFFIRLGEALFDEGTLWKPAAGICLGILNILGIGFREETVFRGVIANNLGITDLGLLDPHLRRMGDGICHAIPEGHHFRVLSGLTGHLLPAGSKYHGNHPGQ